MKKYIDKWFSNNEKNLTIINFKNAWKENGIKPFLRCRTNGAVKGIHSCFSLTITLFYLDICYTDFNYNKKERRKINE